MLEIKTNVWLPKAKILRIKIATKEGKFWVVFEHGKIEGVEQSTFSSEYASEKEAQAFANACGQQL